MKLTSIRNRLAIRTPQRVEKISKFLAKAAPRYFANKINNPFFIIGCNRSGTTLLVDTLATHPEIATFPHEANDLWHPQAYPWLHSKHRDCLPPIGVDPVKYSQLTLKYRTSYDTRFLRAVFGAYEFLMRKKVFLNKSAMITFMIPYILETFPGVKIIHIVRDGRGVALSWAKKEFKQVEKNLSIYERQGFGISFDELLSTFSKTWKLHIEEVDIQKKLLDLDGKGIIFELRYEDFCSNPLGYLCKLADFMGVSPGKYKMLDYSHIINMNYKYREQIDDDVVRILTQTMEPSLERWGYL